MAHNLKLLNVNASRISRKDRIVGLMALIKCIGANIICIQEINIREAYKVFVDHFQVIINGDESMGEGIGIVTLVNKHIKIEGKIIAEGGRILGVKLNNMQVWNVYPISGSGNKPKREVFFREELINLMMNWKDETKYIFQVGDHNCTHRDEDSINNPKQHKQAGLIHQMKILGLKDAFIQYYGEKEKQYSRITNKSATRIDLILSNTKSCKGFIYMDAKLDFDHKMALAEFDIEMGKTK